MESHADSDRVTLEVNRHELLLINNALNEVCHGVEIEDAEFQTRLGGLLTEAQELLHRIASLLRSPP